MTMYEAYNPLVFQGFQNWRSSPVGDANIPYVDGLNMVSA